MHFCPHPPTTSRRSLPGTRTASRLVGRTVQGDMRAKPRSARALIRQYGGQNPHRGALFQDFSPRTYLCTASGRVLSDEECPRDAKWKQGREGRTRSSNFTASKSCLQLTNGKASRDRRRSSSLFFELLVPLTQALYVPLCIQFSHVLSVSLLCLSDTHKHRHTP